MPNIKAANFRLHARKAIGMRGFSVVELLVVVALIFIIVSFTVFSLVGHQRLYRTDDQSLQVIDLLQEGRQRSLTQREVLRVEINRTTQFARLIDENDPSTSDDDVVLRSVRMSDPANVHMGDSPSNILDLPPEPLQPLLANFTPSVYPDSATQDVCTMRFMPNGQVFDAGNNATGAGAVPTGVTLNVWTPAKTDPTEYDVARSITVVGATGSIRFWEYDASLPTANKWKDSRRTASAVASTP